MTGGRQGSGSHGILQQRRSRVGARRIVNNGRRRPPIVRSWVKGKGVVIKELSPARVDKIVSVLSDKGGGRQQKMKLAEKQKTRSLEIKERTRQSEHFNWHMVRQVVGRSKKSDLERNPRKGDTVPSRQIKVQGTEESSQGKGVRKIKIIGARLRKVSEPRGQRGGHQRWEKKKRILSPGRERQEKFDKLEVLQKSTESKTQRVEIGDKQEGKRALKEVKRVGHFRLRASATIPNRVHAGGTAETGRRP